MATPIQVVLVDVPLMMRDIIHRALEGQSDISVADGAALPRTGDRRSESEKVVITSSAHPGDTTAAEWLLSVPRDRVLVFASDGREAVMHETHVRTTPYPDIDPAELPAVIRRRAYAPITASSRSTTENEGDS